MTAIDTSTEAVERLLDGVTPGPWGCMDYTTEDPTRAGWYIVPPTAVGTIAKVNPHFDEDSRFIAAARDLVPALLKERDEARALISAAISRAEYHADRNTTAADVFRDISALAKTKGTDK